MRKKKKLKDMSSALSDTIFIGSELEKHKGKWNFRFAFQQPIWLELGTGRGDYLIGIAKIHPEINFLGVDIKIDRLVETALKAKEEGLENICLTSVNYKWLDHFFEKGEIAGLIVNFPEPRIKAKQAKWRFSHPANLTQIVNILGIGGEIWFKTDDLDFYKWSEPFLNEVLDIYFLSKDFKEEASLITQYEKRWIKEGKKIIMLKGKIKKLTIETEVDIKSWKDL